MIPASDILLITDDPGLYKTLAEMLSEHVSSLVPLASGSVLIDEVVRRRPRLIFVQDDLKSRDGLLLGTEIVKRTDSIVVLIARSESRAVHAYYSGIPHFLLSPLRQEQLRTVLNLAIARKPENRHPLARDRSLLRFRTRRGFIFVIDTEVIWISAAANYLEIHCVAETHRVRGSVSHAAEQLRDNPQFLRIHRSIIANMRYVREVRSSGTGEYLVVLNDLHELPVSRRQVIDDWISLACNMSFTPDLQEGTASEQKSDSACGGDVVFALPQSNRI